MIAVCIFGCWDYFMYFHIVLLFRVMVPKIHMDLLQLCISLSYLQIRLHSMLISGKELLIHPFVYLLTHSLNRHPLLSKHLSFARCGSSAGNTKANQVWSLILSGGRGRDVHLYQCLSTGKCSGRGTGGVTRKGRSPEFFPEVLGKAAINRYES